MRAGDRLLELHSFLGGCVDDSKFLDVEALVLGVGLGVLQDFCDGACRFYGVAAFWACGSSGVVCVFLMMSTVCDELLLIHDCFEPGLGLF